MAVPPFHAFLSPCLRHHLDGEEHAFKELLPICAELFRLTEADLAETIPSGQTKYANRIQWALSYLRAAKLLESTRRGFNRITARGHEFWQQTGGQFGLEDLEQFPEFLRFKTVDPERKRPARKKVSPEELTPTERMRAEWEELNAALQEEVLDAVRLLSPARFERLVVDLMLKLGYGSSDERAGEVTPLSGDEGVDGVISEDRLGLGKIYLQAKRYTGDRKLGRPDVQAFVGALVGKGASKGVFLSTAEFTQEAFDYVRRLTDQKIALVGGRELARLMIETGLGVSVAETLEIKKLDRDYFEDEA